MTDEQMRPDGETDTLLAEFWSTPVGRRWVLKAGLGAAAAAAASGVWPAYDAAQAARRKTRHHRRPRRHERVTLQFALGHLRHHSHLVLVANGKRYRLVRHTSRSRAALRAKRGLWAKMDLSVLSHH